ncbi:hypothetical protein Ciccas_012962 [Cichlidogyrus casuarinus]|uniref:Beta-1,4-galactosyltransferase n=1 Tax=Cichlidogyrus casuarinus TaxID=1844966 RepID=A0ABD2PLV8_9PLAT
MVDSVRCQKTLLGLMIGLLILYGLLKLFQFDFFSQDFDIDELDPLLVFNNNSSTHDEYWTALILPYRDRVEDLHKFLQRMHPYLKMRNLSYQIYVVEQFNTEAFNRGLLMNVGFMEARKERQYDCYIFHDVDLLPVDGSKMSYRCDKLVPLHMSTAVDTLGKGLLYETLFGGVTALTAAMMEKTGGYPNRYFGWGGEDDDLSERVRHFYGPKIKHLPPEIGAYIMTKHSKEAQNNAPPSRTTNLNRWKEFYTTDTFRNLRYEVVEKQLIPKKQFTWISITFDKNNLYLYSVTWQPGRREQSTTEYCNVS